MMTFLKRSWRIVTGSAREDDLHFTIVHTCAFHFIRNCRDIVKRCFTNKTSQVSAMWILSYLMNIGIKSDMDEFMRLITLLTRSKYVSDQVSSSQTAINKLLKNFKQGLGDEQQQGIQDSVELVRTGKKEREPVVENEEDYYFLTPDSPFKLHYKGMIDSLEGELNTSEDDLPLNAMHSDTFISDIMKRLIPTMPLWNRFMLGDLSRHGTSSTYLEYKVYKQKNPTLSFDTKESFVVSSRTTGISEKRMGVLFQTLQGGKKKCRLDDFIRSFHQDQIGIQRIFFDSVVNQPKSKRTSNVMTEQWKKSRVQPKKKLTFQEGSRKEKTVRIKEKETKKKAKENKKINKPKSTENKTELGKQQRSEKAMKGKATNEYLKGKK